MKNYFPKKPQGYIAVISALILSTVLTTGILAVSTSIFWNRFEKQERADRQKSLLLAESCIYEAILLYAEDSRTRLHSLLVSVDSHATCAIDSVASQGNTQTFTAHSFIKNARVFLQATTYKNSSHVLSITSWHELTGIPP
jgi:fructose-specific phosphotransferase system IIC component